MFAFAKAYLLKSLDKEKDTGFLKKMLQAGAVTLKFGLVEIKHILTWEEHLNCAKVAK